MASPLSRQFLLLLSLRKCLFVSSIYQFSCLIRFFDVHRGGLEILFANTRKLQLSIPAKHDDGKRPNIAWLIHYLVEHEMKDSRRELFVLEGHV